jgi:hypothetical protein
MTHELTPLPCSHWQFSSTEPTPPELPDGIRDLIFHFDRTQSGQWFVASLTRTACCVASARGALFVGYRFQTAAVVNQAGLLAARGARFTPRIGLTNDFLGVDRSVTQASTGASAPRIPQLVWRTVA